MRVLGRTAAASTVLLLALGCTDDGTDSGEPQADQPSATGSLSVAAPTPTGSAQQRCAELVGRLPDQVDGRSARAVATELPVVAWGDPPIVLRCGGAEPAALTPTSFCYEVDGVGWLTTIAGAERPPTAPTTRTQVFTTIGRSPVVAVTIPGDYATESSGVLADVADAVRSSTAADPDTCL